MTLIASLLFLSALAASAFAIALTISDSMPRIVDVIEQEFAPAMKIERRIHYGVVKQRSVSRSAHIIAFVPIKRTEQQFKLAA